MATILEMPKKQHATPVPTINMYGTIVTLEYYLHWQIDQTRKSEFAEFVSNLETARMVYRKFPALVVAETINLPEEFIEAFRRANGCEPFEIEPEQLGGCHALDPDVEDWAVRSAIDSAIRDSPDSDPDLLRKYLVDLLTPAA